MVRICGLQKEFTNKDERSMLSHVGWVVGKINSKLCCAFVRKEDLSTYNKKASLFTYLMLLIKYPSIKLLEPLYSQKRIGNI